MCGMKGLCRMLVSEVQPQKLESLPLVLCVSSYKRRQFQPINLTNQQTSEDSPRFRAQGNHKKDTPHGYCLLLFINEGYIFVKREWVAKKDTDNKVTVFPKL